MTPNASATRRMNVAFMEYRSALTPERVLALTEERDELAADNATLVAALRRCASAASGERSALTPQERAREEEHGTSGTSLGSRVNSVGNIVRATLGVGHQKKSSAIRAQALLNVVRAAEPLLPYAEEMILDIAADRQEGGNGAGLDKWNNFVSAVRALKDSTNSKG